MNVTKLLSSQTYIFLKSISYFEQPTPDICEGQISTKVGGTETEKDMCSAVDITIEYGIDMDDSGGKDILMCFALVNSISSTRMTGIYFDMFESGNFPRDLIIQNFESAGTEEDTLIPGDFKANLEEDTILRGDSSSPYDISLEFDAASEVCFEISTSKKDLDPSAFTDSDIVVNLVDEDDSECHMGGVIVGIDPCVIKEPKVSGFSQNIRYCNTFNMT